VVGQNRVHTKTCFLSEAQTHANNHQTIKRVFLCLVTIMGRRAIYSGIRPTQNFKIIDEHDGFEVWVGTKMINEWINVKFVSKTVKKKANYWIGYNTKEKRFANGRDLSVMIEHQPKLATYLEQFISSFPISQQQSSESHHV
jgi:hypothetical protein